MKTAIALTVLPITSFLPQISIALIPFVLTLPFLLLRTYRRSITEERHLVMAASCASLLISLYFFGGFDKLTSGFQWISEYPLLPPYNLYFPIGMDGISALFLLLTLFTFPLLFLAA